MLWFSTRRAQETKDIQERLEKLEHEIKALRWEWDDAYDKLRTLTARFAKRAQQIEKHEAMVQTAAASPTGSTTATSVLDPMTKRILERRQKLFPEVKKEASS